MKKCPVCRVSVKAENLERHLRDQHPRERVEVRDLLTESELREAEAERRSSRPPMTRRGIRLIAITAAVLAALLVLAILNPFGNVGPGIGQVAPDFTRTTTNGGSVTLSGLRGRPVLLAFMDVDCPACQNEAGNVLPALYANYSARVRFLSIDVNFVGPADTAERIEAFKATYGTDWTYALDVDQGVMRAYGVTATPTTFVLDRNGVVTAVFRGSPSGGYAAYAGVLDAALG